MHIIVTILRNHGRPLNKLADAELHFIGGELDGLKLVGFAIWQKRHASGRSVTFPAHPDFPKGEQRSFPLVRAINDRSAEDRLRQLVLQAYAEQGDALAETDRGAP